MIKRNFLLTFRNLRRNIIFTIIIIGGLSIGITTFLSIIQWTSWHASFDRHIPNNKNIYRLSLHENRENFERHTARIIHGDIVQQLYNNNDITDIKKTGRLAPFRNAIVRKNDIVFYEDKTFGCDHDFIEIFQPEMLLGYSESLLKNPNEVILSLKTAKKYFGEENPVGKSIEILHQFEMKPTIYEIKGVFKDFPENTHFTIDILASFKEPEKYNGTAWVYLLLTENADIHKIEEQLAEFIIANNPEDYSIGIEPILMPLKDIHLRSHLARELEMNVHLRTILIMFTAGFLVFVLAWFNFTLLAISQKQLNAKKLIYQWQMGANKRSFFLQFLTEFFITGFISFLLAIVLSFLLNTLIRNTFGVSILENKELFFLSVLVILFILTLSSILTSLYATQRIYKTIKLKYFAGKKSHYNHVSSKNWFISAIIVIEFVITYVLVSNLMMIREQVNYSISQQIGAKDTRTIQIPNLPREVINHYSTFRDELLKYPVFEDVTAMMEEPGGMAMDAFTYKIEGLPESENRLYLFPVDENFNRFYDIHILAGKDFPTDFKKEDSTEFYILNETAAMLYDSLKYEDLIGRELTISFNAGGLINPGKIIGISEDFHLSNMENEVNPMVIFPKYTWLYCFSIRIDEKNPEAITLLRKQWKEFYPRYPLRFYYTSEIYRTLYSTELTEIRVLLLFSILSMLIAGTGLFALSAFFMQQKMHAASIRKINGAKMIQILFPELLQYLYLALISTLIGIPASWFSINSWLRNFSYQSEISIWIFVFVALFLIVFSWIAVLYHAIRLARLNPTAFIRSE